MTTPNQPKEPTKADVADVRWWWNPVNKLCDAPEGYQKDVRTLLNYIDHLEKRISKLEEELDVDNFLKEAIDAI